jgi:predicted DNA-binding protein YlxM (UPF0122 family)
VKKPISNIKKRNRRKNKTGKGAQRPLSHDIIESLESGAGLREAFKDAWNKKLSTIEKIASDLSNKDTLKKILVEKMFPENDIFSAYIRGKLIPKDKDNISPEPNDKITHTTPTSLSENSQVYLKIIAKNSLSLPGIARDVNVLRRNIVSLVKLKGGKTSKFGGKADAQYKTSKQLNQKLNKLTSPSRTKNESKTPSKISIKKTSNVKVPAAPAAKAAATAASSAGEGGIISGILETLFGFFAGVLPSVIRTLLNPKALLRIFSRIFVIASLIGALFSGIVDAWEKWKETGSLKEALIEGIASFVDFLTFGLIGKDNVKDFLGKIGTFIEPFIKTIKDMYYNIKDWIVNNIGIPKISLGTWFGKERSIGPYYPFKNDTTSEKNEISVREEPEKKQTENIGKGGESGGAGATGSFETTSDKESTSANLVSGISLRLPPNVTYDGSTGNFVYKGISFKAGNQQELNSIVKSIDNSSVIEYDSKDSSGENVIKTFDGSTGESSLRPCASLKIETPTKVTSPESDSSTTPSTSDSAETSSPSSIASASDSITTPSTSGEQSSSETTSNIKPLMGYLFDKSKMSSPLKQMETDDLDKIIPNVNGSDLMNKSSDIAEAQRLEFSDDNGNIEINSPTTNNNSSSTDENTNSPIENAYDDEMYAKFVTSY